MHLPLECKPYKMLCCQAIWQYSVASLCEGVIKLHSGNLQLKARDSLQGQLLRAHMMSLEPIFLLLSPPVAIWLPSAVLNLWLYMMVSSNYKNIIKFQIWWERVHSPRPPPPQHKQKCKTWTSLALIGLISVMCLSRNQSVAGGMGCFDWLSLGLKLYPQVQW